MLLNVPSKFGMYWSFPLRGGKFREAATFGFAENAIFKRAILMKAIDERVS
jgi:hypothetical protein